MSPVEATVARCQCGRTGKITRGMCRACYERWRRHHPELVTKPVSLTERFFSYIDRETTACWLWTGSISDNGYGNFYRSGRTVLAHRFSYELLVGPIPAGLVIDHICRVRRCVNPDHLRPLTEVRNILIGISPSAINGRKTHCKRGHEFTAENTYSHNGKRQCRTCRAASSRAIRAARVARAALDAITGGGR